MCISAFTRLTVQKEGPNKGRQFYACPKPREQSCGFFEWADADDNGSGGASYGGGMNMTHSKINQSK